MSKDLDVIKKLGKKFAIELNQLSIDEIIGITNGYAIDKGENIIGLNLDQLQISDYSFIKDLTSLTRLCLSRNHISDISFLKGLMNLSYLYLSRNQISDISLLIDLTNLKHLNLGYNHISDISPLKNLKNLIKLYLNHNQISNISFLKNLINLTWLNLRNNKIYELPDEILDLNMEIKWEDDYKDGIFLEGNLIERPPIEIEKEGREAVKAYFRDLLAGQKKLNEVKVLFVGEGGAGKTSLVKRLRGESFDKNEAQTHGINIDPWVIKLEKDDIKVHLWDFGGQEIMHATHQFFLSKRSLYLLVVDGRKDDKTEYWLKHTESFGGDSPVMVVINKIDENPSFNLNMKHLQEKYKNIKGFYRVSCLKKDGIEILAQNLEKELANIEMAQEPWPLNWFKVKTLLENITEDFISYNQYKEICTKEKIDEELGQKTLVDFLHDLGVVLHFKDFELEDTHVLNPRWLTTAVYKIINDEKLAESKGMLKLDLLVKILKPSEKKDYFYPNDKHKFIIHIMKKFELCYDIESQTILIPDLLEIQEPDFYFDYNMSLKFQLEYEFLPKSIIPRFIVKMHQDIKDRLQWRTGVVLYNEAFRSTAVIKVDEREQTISINVNGYQKRDYFAVLRNTFSQINRSFKKIDVKEKVPLPDNPEIKVEYEHLRVLEEKGLATFIPQGSRKFYNVSELLGTININMYHQLWDQLKDEFSELSKLAPQKRGYEFEKFLNRLFKLFDLNPSESFRNTGEQIDGSFQIGDNTYLVEAKWQNKKTGLRDLLVFNEKVSGKLTGTRGLFISISGFTKDGLKSFTKGRKISIIGMDRKDLEYIMENNLTFTEAINLKSRQASKTCEFYVPLKELKK